MEKLPNQSIMSAVLNNDTATVVKLLENAGFNGKKNVINDTREHRLLSATLSIASTQAWMYLLKPDLFSAIITRVAPAIDQFYLLELVCQITGKKLDKELDEKLFQRMIQKGDDKPMTEVLKELDYGELRMFIIHIAESNVVKIPMDFFTALLFTISERGILSSDMLLAYMAITLKEPIFGKSKEQFIEGMADAVLEEMKQRDHS